jgi:hypothetical protein
MRVLTADPLMQGVELDGGLTPRLRRPPMSNVADSRRRQSDGLTDLSERHPCSSEVAYA